MTSRLGVGFDQYCPSSIWREQLAGPLRIAPFLLFLEVRKSQKGGKGKRTDGRPEGGPRSAQGRGRPPQGGTARRDPQNTLTRNTISE